MGPVDVYVSAPWSLWLDIALPLAVAHARMLACVLVPREYTRTACLPRRQYLDGLQEEGRLVVMPGLGWGSGPGRSWWLLVFATSWLRDSMCPPMPSVFPPPASPVHAASPPSPALQARGGE